MLVTLAPHPDTPCPALERLTATVEGRPDGVLGVRYIMIGDLGALAMPAPASAARTDGLWQHTCFEAFVRRPRAEGYLEFNFAPSTQWAAYQCAAYRSGMAELDVAAPHIAGAPRRDGFELNVSFALPDDGPWHVALSAVIELKDGAKSYWALKHPPQRSPTSITPKALRWSCHEVWRRTSAGRREPARAARGQARRARRASRFRDARSHALTRCARGAFRYSHHGGVGPQHGMRGEKQDNMIESADYTDPVHGVPVFSLYGEVRRPSGQMMSTFDVVLIDLQDLGCRIYTFITTLLYMLEAAAEHGKEVWGLDRPNPAGRPIEGLTLRSGWESFVGAGPMPMRHGLTLGELGHWFIDHFKLDVPYRVIKMEGYAPDAAPGFGWPIGERSWVNPSPNAPNLWMARAYAGTVMLEGATLSEGRGTTRPLEVFGAPDIKARDVLSEMHALAPEWLKGCVLRECWFEPTFHKHMKQLCSGVQIHVEDPTHYDHAAFKPWRIQALAFKAIRRLYPTYELWRDFPYEYAFGKLPIDVINGSPLLREWVDDANATPADLDALTVPDEQAWASERAKYLLYR
ncbi:MAG: DUF1343 domain-containing protein [Hyphomonadaceae bacterium]